MTHEEIDGLLKPARDLMMELRCHVQADTERLDERILSPVDSQLRKEIIAARDEVGCEGPWDARVVLDELLISAGTVQTLSYQVYSIGRLLHAPVSMRAVQALVRTALETAARAWWLLDPALTIRQRVTRSIGVTLQSMRDEQRAWKKLGEAGPLKRSNEQINHLVEWARYIGLAITADKLGQPRLAEFTPSTASEMVAKLGDEAGGSLGGSALYSWLSASTHGAALHMVPFTDGVPQVPRTNCRELAWVLKPAVISLRATHLRLAEYVGASSVHRSRPYDALLRELHSKRSDKTPVGVF
ncbi:hypothetical protein AB0B66_18845 [Catellatospora sp. NPDC049111]|uniref:hypothetical protein n=1 Tax=Catellatospora sp. NPDC049111 TaxID=3155271 RepID=UPI0033E70746